MLYYLVAVAAARGETAIEYPALFVSAANAFDAADLYRSHYADYDYTVVEVYRVPETGAAPMVHRWDDLCISAITDFNHPVTSDERMPF